MAPYLGLRGQRMTLARIVMIVLPAFLLFGYNQSQIGGVLGFTSFIKVFPQLNTTTTKGAEKSHNATIQGMTAFKGLVSVCGFDSLVV